MSVWTAVGGVLTLLPSLLKKKPFCLWYQGTDGKWRLRAGPFSARQCRKQMAVLIETGFRPDGFKIFRKGVDPNKVPGEGSA